MKPKKSGKRARKKPPRGDASGILGIEMVSPSGVLGLELIGASFEIVKLTRELLELHCRAVKAVVRAVIAR